MLLKILTLSGHGRHFSCFHTRSLQTTLSFCCCYVFCCFFFHIFDWLPIQLDLSHLTLCVWQVEQVSCVAGKPECLCKLCLCASRRMHTYKYIYVKSIALYLSIAKFRHMQLLLFLFYFFLFFVVEGVIFGFSPDPLHFGFLLSHIRLHSYLCLCVCSKIYGSSCSSRFFSLTALTYICVLLRFCRLT